jgi:prepilin-type processing-associated H-X9-DG protein
MFPYQSATWIPALQPVYAGVSNVVICPLTGIWNPQPTGVDTVGDYKTAWYKNINSPTIPAYNGSYGFNGWLYAGDWTFASVGSTSEAYYKDTAVKYPTQTPIFGDGIWVDAWPELNDACNTGNLQTGGAGNVGNPSSGGPQGMDRYLIARHGPHRPTVPPTGARINQPFPGGVNMVFFDGHVEDVALNDLWTLCWHPEWVSKAKPTQ